ncbi:MAG: class I SAM-dependent methyltransferase [Magnetococcales bacterium]|nr:class I SAM-dependent methyltransferase [Magnetococcales bacterium]
MDAPLMDFRRHTDVGYRDRASRAGYVFRNYQPLLQESVLDVGSWQCCLKPLLPSGCQYIGVDVDSVHGTPDVIVNLERGGLPFVDRSFHCVVCTDVLEHLDNCHQVFDELCRVASSYIILSLPNPLGNIYQLLCQGGWVQHKYYTLSSVQHDRHKWFFGSRDAEMFVRQRGDQNGYFVRQLDFSQSVPEEGTGLQGFLRRKARDFLFRHSPEIPYLYKGDLWCVLERKKPEV